MTDKEQIMINGVDVSGCEYLTYELEEDGEYYWFCKISPTGGPDECEYNPECFYKRVLKQLARKTQECEQKEKELNGSEKWRIKAEGLNEKLELKNTRYLKALGEIEEHYEKVIKNLTTCDDSYDANISIEALHNISDIINKAKGGK